MSELRHTGQPAQGCGLPPDASRLRKPRRRRGCPDRGAAEGLPPSRSTARLSRLSRLAREDREARLLAAAQTRSAYAAPPTLLARRGGQGNLSGPALHRVAARSEERRVGKER